MAHNRGNILFLILLAVVLFAALAYAVTSSIRGGGKDAAAENSIAAATQLINYAASYENAVMRMSMNIPYQNIQYYTGTNSACADATCRIFSPTGGGIERAALDTKYVLNPSLTGGSANGNNWQIRLIKVENVGTAKPEIALVAFGIKKEICQAINQALGITTSSSAGVPSGITASNTSGSHILDQSHGPSDITADTVFFRYINVGATGYSAEVASRPSFCICESPNCNTVNDGYKYSFWHVVMPQ